LKEKLLGERVLFLFMCDSPEGLENGMIDGVILIFLLKIIKQNQFDCRRIGCKTV
jgi:hypothetical protein